ncbi:uncharacterized protein LOC129759242, partial [Uranotaenia lowii]|uniref:uncharacterized protein LOC129759242 n=1 Tax=Uranotaenia lowii TaxID=190385 RepID=UPI00247AEE6F
MSPHSCREEDPCYPKPRSGKPPPAFPKPLITLGGAPATPLNPGDFAGLHKLTYDLRPEWFEGFQLNATKYMDLHQLVRCSWNLSHITPTGFRIGAQLHRKCSDSILKTPLISFDTNPSTLSSNLYLLYRPRPSVCVELNIQTLPHASTSPIID